MRIPDFPRWLIAAFTALAAFGPTGSSADTPGNALIVAQDIEGIISLDPAEAFEEMSLQMTGSLYDRLFAYDPASDTRLKPQVAKSWSVSEDGLTYTFDLNEGYLFASGNPITAEDIVYSLRRVLLLKKSPGILLAQIGLTLDNMDAALSAPSPHTFVLRLSARYAPGIVLGVMSSLPASVVDSKVAMEHAEGDDYGNGWLKAHSAGSGPFRLNNWKPSESIIFDNVANYHGGAAPMKRVIYRHVKEGGTQQLLLSRGDVDMALNLGPEQIAALAGNPDLKAVSFPRGQIIYLALNQSVEAFANLNVKEAIRYLIDYQGISRDVLQGRYAVHQSFWPAGAPLALEETPYHLDVDKAKALLAEAGYGDGLSFEMDVINQYPYPDIAQAIQASMAKGGVEVKLVMSDQRALIGKYRARNHQAAIVYWGPDYFDIHSNAGAFAWSPNPGPDSTFKTPPWRNNWDIPELTRLTEALAVETDPEVRRKGYMEMQADYQANAPIITMLQRSDVAVMKKSVDGLVVGPLMFQFVLDKVTKQ